MAKAQELKIFTKHPRGKSGKSISKDKYDAIKEAMLKVLKGKELTHNELFNKIEQLLKRKFDGNVSWYAETVKLDLEARKRLKRIDSKPQKYKLI